MVGVVKHTLISFAPRGSRALELPGAQVSRNDKLAARDEKRVACHTCWPHYLSVFWESSYTSLLSVSQW